MHTKIDLNLFIVLKAIADTGSITKAAKHLHLTQPAVSHALARLRSHFNDPLFTQLNRKMVPSPLTLTILPKVELSLTHLLETVNIEQDFDISATSTTVRLGFRDILESLFFPTLIADMATKAPMVKVFSQQVKLVEMERALLSNELDIVIDALTPVSDAVEHTLLCEESFALVTNPHHPFHQAPTLTQYLSFPHVVASIKGSKVDAIDLTLASLGSSRNVMLRCEHFFAAASVVANSEYLLTMPRSYAEKLAHVLPIKVTTLPFVSPKLPVHIYWAKQAAQHPINKWMCEQLKTISESLFITDH